MISRRSHYLIKKSSTINNNIQVIDIISIRKLSSILLANNKHVDSNKSILNKLVWTRLTLLKQSRSESNSSHKSLNWLIRPQREKDETATNIDFKSMLDTNKYKNTDGGYYHEKIILGYSREQMCNLVFDVKRYKEFVPFCINSEILITNENNLARQTNKINLVQLNNKNNMQMVKKNLEEANAQNDTVKSFKARLDVGFPPLRESYVSHVSMIKPQLVKAISRDTKLFEYLINEWKFHPYHISDKPSSPGDVNSLDKENCCLVEFYVSFKFRSILYTQFSNLFLDQIVKQMVKAFTYRAEKLYGKPSIPPKNII